MRLSDILPGLGGPAFTKDARTRPRGVTRCFTVDDVPWRVFEYPDGASRPGQCSLVFASDTVWRRFRNFPADWATLDDEALFKLSTGR